MKVVEGKTAAAIAAFAKLLTKIGILIFLKHCSFWFDDQDKLQRQPEQSLEHWKLINIDNICKSMATELYFVLSS